MIERLRRLLREYRDIISSVEYTEIRTIGQLTILRIKLILIDGSRAYIREIWGVRETPRLQLLVARHK